MVHPYAFLQECSLDSTCQWLGHKGCQVILQVTGKTGSECTGISANGGKKNRPKYILNSNIEGDYKG